MDLLNQALALAAQGFHVFPCQENGKTPVIKDFPNRATRDPEQIRRWFSGTQRNIGISTSHFGDNQALIVVDVDNKNGKNGDTQILTLELAGFELPPSFEQSTPSGGRHVIYVTDQPCRQGVNVLGEGLDIRSRGGYVVGPGSTIDGKSYGQINGHTPVAPAPQWLIDRLGSASVAPSGDKAPLGGVDTPRALARALAYLETAPEAVEGDGGDQTTYKVAAKLKDFGVDREMALDLLLGHWNERCQPPWEAEALKVKVENAYRYGENPQGSRAPEAVFTAMTTGGGKEAGGGKAAREGVCLLRGDDVPIKAIEWLWDGWLAAGKLHVFGGAPGTGKTTISLSLAATVTTGGRWPDGRQAEPGNVVIWSGEDDPADTLIPRLALMGADLSRVYFIDGIREGNERRSFDPARDMEPLQRKLAEIGGVRLLIVDPIVSAIAGDSHKNAEVRRGLQPLVDLAGSLHCALLGITHFSKGTGGRDPVERLTGSLAFGALARVVLVAAKHQEEGDDGRASRLFCRAKSNIGPDDGGFEYDLHQAELKAHPGVFASSVLWGEAVAGGARVLLARADAIGDEGEGTLTDAKRFLIDLLAGGPLSTKAIKAEAADAGYSWATLRRAKKALDLNTTKESFKSGWLWGAPSGYESPKVVFADV